MESTNAWVPFFAIGALLSCVGSISIGLWLVLRVIGRRFGHHGSPGPGWRRSLIVALGPAVAGLFSGAFLSVFVAEPQDTLIYRLQLLAIWGVVGASLASIGSQLAYRIGYALRGERVPGSGWISLAGLFATLVGHGLTWLIGMPPLLSFCGGPFFIVALVVALPWPSLAAEPVGERPPVPQTVVR